MKSIAATNNVKKRIVQNSVVKIQRETKGSSANSFPRVIRPANPSVRNKPKGNSNGYRIGNPTLVWAIVAAAIGTLAAFIMPDIIAALWLFFTS